MSSPLPTSTSTTHCYIDFDIDGSLASRSRAAEFVNATDSRYGFTSKDLIRLGGSELNRLQVSWRAPFVRKSLFALASRFLQSRRMLVFRSFTRTTMSGATRARYSTSFPLRTRALSCASSTTCARSRARTLSPSASAQRPQPPWAAAASRCTTRTPPCTASSDTLWSRPATLCSGTARAARAFTARSLRTRRTGCS